MPLDRDIDSPPLFEVTWRAQCQFEVGSRVGAVVLSDSVSNSRLIKRSMRISRTTLSCTLLIKGYETYRSGAAFRDPTIAYSTASSRIRLRLDVNPSASDLAD